MRFLTFLFACAIVFAQDLVRVPASEQERKLVEKIVPAYPPLAKARRITGTVVYTVTVGKDGTILNSKLISGHPLLVPAAAEALRKYVYRPTIVRGEPVEVITQVRFKFEPDFQPAGSPAPFRIGHANLIKRVEPILSPDAARINGTVRLTVIVAKDGTVQNIQLVSGHPILAAAAIEALKQWIYKPTLLNGDPVEVVMPVDISFGRLSQPAPRSN